jgi:hypothetical protein
VPRDVIRADIVGRSAGPERAASLVSWTAFFEALRRAGERILIVDTCHAGAPREASIPFPAERSRRLCFR